MRRFALALAAGLALLQPASTALHAQTQPLTFFKNYFLTGDYAVEGVGLFGLGSGGVATGDIVVGSVPANVDIVAAFLYWQVVGTVGAPDAGATGVTFKGNLLSSAEGPFAKSLGAGTPPCWANGGGTGASNGSNRTYSYRADVLRFLDVDPVTGKLAANGHHTVTLPDGAGLSAVGASLVVVYRDPSLPLSAIVLYDGAYTMDQSTEGMALAIDGFYDAGSSGKLTHIVGSGQANKSENLTYNGAPLAVNPFASTAGPKWDNPTFTLAADPARTTVTTGVNHDGFNSFDCLTWAAVVYRTTVKDSDGDGLLDRWESSTDTLYDPYGRPLPNLAAMGAAPDRKDLFIEVGYLKTDVPTAYGGLVKPAHSHLPSHEALRLVGRMFEDAPTGAVAVHFDVGNAYPPGPADPYIIRGAGLARGGEAIDESVSVCTPSPGAPAWECQFSAYPGTVGWKTGFRLLRDEVLVPQVPLADGTDPCELPGNTCARRFDETRHDMFRYALFAHALGLPRSELACLDGAGQPVDDVNGVCAVAANPEFHVPRTNTGVADFPGADILVTLGGFADAAGLPVGTPFMQASTLAHEFGHNAERRHGGPAFEPNCKPTYFSVMNYLYQLRGLLDDTGTPHLDFSGAINGQAIDETTLTDGSHSYMPYRLGWYAPLAQSYLAGRSPAARTHCDGSPLLRDAGGMLVEPPMVRIDARLAADAIDWNADGDLADTATFQQDVNFNGRLDGAGNPPFGALLGSDDWSALRLDQIGARRNVGGLYVDADTGRFAVGPLSLAVGKGDLGKGDLGKGDLGKGDLGKGDLGKGDLGKGDLGKGDLGKGDLGKGDLGGGDLFQGDPNNPGGELDAETAGDLARTPPNQFQACVTGVGGCTAPGAQLHDVVAQWTVPNVGGVGQYTLYRVEGAALTPGQAWTPVATIPATPGQLAYGVIDTTELVDGASYTYFAVANYADGVLSDPSNLVTIEGVNDPPVAGDDSYSVNEDSTLTVAAPGVLANDGDPDSPVALTAALVNGPSHGTLTLEADGRFVYTPAADYFGADSFTYRAISGAVTTNTATVAIAVSPVNDPPAAFDIADVTIDQDATTGPLPFVLADENPATVTLSAVSSDPVLVPLSAIVFGGSGAARTVTVTPTPGRAGTAVIAVTATDEGGLPTTDNFTLTVRAAARYTFVGVQNAPPPDKARFKAGSAIPMKWYFTAGTGWVDSSHLSHRVTVRGPLPNGPVIDITNTDPGGSSFRYSANDGTWYFNLQTKAADGTSYAVGDYEVTITPSDPRYRPSATFRLRLVK